MKDNLTELVFILDKSGSMSGLEKDTIGGFNSLIEKQKKEEGDVLVTTVLFNHKMEVIHDRVDIKKVNPLTSNEYYPSGCTALLDTIGNTITHIRRVREDLSESLRPSKTLVVITTDGMENSSIEYNYSKIKELISTAKEKDGFEFIFLGANIDSAEEASKLGIDREQACDFNNDSEGIKLNYDCLCAAIKDVKSGLKPTSAWHKKIDQDKKKRKV